MHNVVNITFLEPAAKGEDPFNCVQPPPDTVHDEHYPDEDDRFDVEKIIAKRSCQIGRARRLFTEYLV